MSIQTQPCCLCLFARPTFDTERKRKPPLSRGYETDHSSNLNRFVEWLRKDAALAPRGFASRCFCGGGGFELSFSSFFFLARARAPPPPTQSND